MPAVVVSTAPTIEPIQLTDAKVHLRVEDDEDNTYIEGLIKKARLICEHEIQRAFITQTVDYYLDGFPGGSATQLYNLGDKRALYVPRPPLISVSSITYTDTDGNSQTLATTEYTVDANMEPGRIVEAWEKTWPSTRSVPNAVKVTYTAGYGANRRNVPETIKQAMLLLIEGWYSNRSHTVATGAVPQALPFTVRDLLATEAWLVGV